MARTYTDEDRVNTLAALEANGRNVSKTSVETGIPRPTIILWRDAIMPALKPPPDTVSSLSDRSDTLAARVLTRIEHFAMGDLRDVVTWDDKGKVTLVASDDLSPAQSAIIQELRFKDGEVIAIRTVDRLGAARTLASIAGLLQHEEPIRGDDNSQHLTVNVIGEVSDDELQRRVRAARTIVEGS